VFVLQLALVVSFRKGGTDTQSRITRLRGLREGGGVNRESPISGDGDLGEWAPRSEDESGTEKGSVWKLIVRKWVLRDGNGIVLYAITHKHVVYDHLLIFIVRVTGNLDSIIFIISQLNYIVMS
jgi:hypothetical protein